jgi:hypothetical protein
VRAGVTWLTTIAYGSLSWERGYVQEWLGTLSAVERCACRVLVLASGATVSAQGL